MIATGRLVTDQDVERLRQLLEQRAMLKGDFTLASGRKSKLYFDSKFVILAPEAVIPVGQLFRQHAIELEATAVGGLAAGSIPISTAIVACEAMDGRTRIRSFYVRPDKKEHGTKTDLFQAFDESGQELLRPGIRAIVVDDVLTTGESFGKAIRAVQAKGATVAAAVTLVDRCEGGAERLRTEFEIPVIAIFKADSEGTLTFHDGPVA